jgi:hypothetical protein
MNRITLSTGRHGAVALVLLCLMALTLCQILGPSARLSHDFRAGDVPPPGLVTTMTQSGASHIPLPSRCAAIKLAPIEITTADFTPTEDICGLVSASTSILPRGAELGVPTPPPRQA